MLDSEKPDENNASSPRQQPLANNLIRFRTGRGLSQADLATLIGITENDLDCIERGLVNVTLDRLSQLAKFVKCSEEDLIRKPKAKRRPVQSRWSRALAVRMASSRDCRTQDALAKKAGVSQSTIGRILRGDVRPLTSTVILLAKALEIPVETLFR
jgi:transcriptional regulator with XRE-family HTH domain